MLSKCLDIVFSFDLDNPSFNLTRIEFYISCKQQDYSKPAKMECLKKYYIKFLARQDSRWNVFYLCTFMKRTYGTLEKVS